MISDQFLTVIAILCTLIILFHLLSSHHHFKILEYQTFLIGLKGIIAWRWVLNQILIWFHLVVKQNNLGYIGLNCSLLLTLLCFGHHFDCFNHCLLWLLILIDYLFDLVIYFLLCLSNPYFILKYPYINFNKI